MSIKDSVASVLVEKLKNCRKYASDPFPLNNQCILPPQRWNLMKMYKHIGRLPLKKSCLTTVQFTNKTYSLTEQLFIRNLTPH